MTRVEPADFSWEHPAQGRATAQAVRRILAEAASADGRSPLNEQALLSLRHEGLSRSSMWSARSAGPDGDQISGFALVDRVPGAPSGSGQPDAGADAAEADLVVAPSARGHGVGRALAEAVLTAFGESRLSAWSHGNHPAAQALASSLGFERVRDLWLMRRSMTDDLPTLTVPDQFVVRAFRPGQDEDAFLALNAAAFANHPEQGSMTRADLDHRMEEPWFDPAGFLVAERQGSGPAELVGFHWTKQHGGEPPYGEVYVVGVSPAAQGTGLGRTLTLAGLHHLRGTGVSEVILYVESDNAPAIAVYERLGFTHALEDTDVMYQR